MAFALMTTIAIAAGLVAVLVRRDAARQRDMNRLTRQLADAHAMASDSLRN